MRASLVGSATVRRHLGIEQEDARVFRPVTIVEAATAARIVSTDPSAAGCPKCARVGIVYDLMPMHVRPVRAEVARELRMRESSVRAREIEWESCPPTIRFDLVHRAIRSVLVLRASSL